MIFSSGTPVIRATFAGGSRGDCSQLGEPFAPLLDELSIMEPFVHDHMHHPQVQGHVRPRGQLQEKIGLFRQVCPAGIDDNQGRSSPLGLVEPKADHWMGFEGVGAHD